MADAAQQPLPQKQKKEKQVRVEPETVEFVYDSLGVSQAENSLNNRSNEWVAFKVPFFPE